MEGVDDTLCFINSWAGSCPKTSVIKTTVTYFLLYQLASMLIFESRADTDENRADTAENRSDTAENRSDMDLTPPVVGKHTMGLSQSEATKFKPRPLTTTSPSVTSSTKT